MIKVASNKIRWAISAVLALLILFGTYRNVFSLAAFLGCCLMVFFFDKESILLQLFFVMPMANIFKLAPGSQSFFTYLILLYVVLHLVMPRKATTLVILFAVYVVVGELLAGQFNVTRTIKLICNILFLSSILNDEVKINHKDIFLSYIFGNLAASVFAIMDSSFFKINSYVGTKEVRTEDMEEAVARFSGLYPDPNYYTIGIIVSLCLVVVLFHRNEMNPIFSAAYSVPAVYFLILTYSKSAVLMLIIPFSILIYSLLKKKRYTAVLLFILSGIIIVLLALSGHIPALEIVISRMSAVKTSEGVDVNALTTGRLDLWITYAKYILKNVKTLILGEAITADLINGHASHNTYLDILFHLGAVGGTLLIGSLNAILKQRTNIQMKRNVMNYSVLMCILIMYFFLGGLFYFDPPFQIFLAFMVINLPLNNISGSAINSNYQENLR